MKLKNGSTTIDPVAALGDRKVLSCRKLGVVCSQRCPGDVILHAYDFARFVRGSGLAIVSGFHSPIERDCLPILLRGSDPIIIVQGHSLSTTRLPMEWQKAIDRGRLLLVSPFRDKQKRVTRELAIERNRFVAAISDEVLIPHAAPGSKAEGLGLNLLASGKRVYTFSDRPGPLLDRGAMLINSDFFSPVQRNVQRAANRSASRPEKQINPRFPDD